MHASDARVRTLLTEYPRTLAPLRTHAHCADRRRPAWRVQEEDEEDEDEDEEEEAADY